MTSTDAKREEQLKKTPGRMFLNGASSIAALFTQQGKKGTNQDAMIVWEVSVFVVIFCLIVVFFSFHAFLLACVFFF